MITTCLNPEAIPGVTFESGQSSARHFAESSPRRKEINQAYMCFAKKPLKYFPSFPLGS